MRKNDAEGKLSCLLLYNPENMSRTADKTPLSDGPRATRQPVLYKVVQLCTSLYKIKNFPEAPTPCHAVLFPSPAKVTIRLILAVILTFGAVQARLSPEQRAKLPPPATGTVDFKRDIQPI